MSSVLTLSAHTREGYRGHCVGSCLCFCILLAVNHCIRCELTQNEDFSVFVVLNK